MKLIEKIFKYKKGDAMTDKAFTRMIATSIAGVVLSLICLCSTTFAWFTDSVPSGNNVIKTSECLLTITVADSGEQLANIENGVALQSGVEYTVTLTLPKDSSSGYCRMETSTGKYYSETLARHTTDVDTVVTYTVTVESDMTVKFITGWGTYSGEPDVTNGGTIPLH